jgi:hypothetical protein
MMKGVGKKLKTENPILGQNFLTVETLGLDQDFPVRSYILARLEWQRGNCAPGNTLRSFGSVLESMMKMNPSQQMAIRMQVIVATSVRDFLSRTLVRMARWLRSADVGVMPILSGFDESEFSANNFSNYFSLLKFNVCLKAIHIHT